MITLNVHSCRDCPFLGMRRGYHHAWESRVPVCGVTRQDLDRKIVVMGGMPVLCPLDRAPVTVRLASKETSP